MNHGFGMIWLCLKKRTQSGRFKMQHDDTLINHIILGCRIFRHFPMIWNEYATLEDSQTKRRILPAKNFQTHLPRVSGWEFTGPQLSEDGNIGPADPCGPHPSRFFLWCPKSWGYPSIHFCEDFPSKQPANLGYPHLWKPSYRNCLQVVPKP